MEAKRSGGVLDITSSDFDVDAFMSQILKERALDELVKEEEDMVNAVRRLDSEVHQIVYENYNKFLTATNTVKTIQDEFDQLDKEMSSLSSNMKNISSLIGQLSGVLGTKRTDISQLGSSYKVINSLKFIFDLPQQMQANFDERKYADVIRVYKLAEEALKKYTDLDNIREIMQKIEDIYRQTKEELVKLIESPVERIETVATAVELLMQTGKNEREVERLLLKAAQNSLRDDLKKLSDEQSVDVLDLVDKACGSFIPNLTLLASLHDRLFPHMRSLLLDMLELEVADFHGVVSRLFLATSNPKDCSIVVRALDRYYRKMSTTAQVVPGLNVQTLSIELIRQVAKHEIQISRQKIDDEMRGTVQEIRQSLLNPHNADLNALASKLEQQFIFHVKTALANLLLFTASDVTFSSLAPQVFQAEFSKCVHEDLLVATFRDLTKIAQEYGNASGELRHVSPTLLLVFSCALFHMTGKSASYLLNLCREQFCLAAASNKLTNGTEITNQLKNSTQTLIRRFAEQRGLQLGENLAKGCDFVRQPVASPAGVRAAIRRAVEECTEVERILAELLGGSEARKETKQRRSQLTDSAPRDSLWCERIDFHQNIHMSKSSITTAIVKVMLKTFIELIRLQTYGKYGIEQIQVDCYYLQRGLSPLVADEVVVNSMIDVALSSALKRTLDPVLIHPSRLMQICEEKQGTN